MKNIKIAGLRVLKLVLSILLIVTALFLFTTLSVAALLFTLISPFFIKDNRNIGEIVDGFSKYFISIAASIDQTGNAAFGKLLTWGLVSKKASSYSIHNDIDDTISEIVGWNELENAQTKTGKILSSILNTAEKDHGALSAANAYWKAKNKVERYKYLEDKLIKFKK